MEKGPKRAIDVVQSAYYCVLRALIPPREAPSKPWVFPLEPTPIYGRNEAGRLADHRCGACGREFIEATADKRPAEGKLYVAAFDE